jgi:hypothetical protein
MQPPRIRFAAVFITLWATCGSTMAQVASPLYSWPGTGDTAQWFRSFGTNTVTLANTGRRSRGLTISTGCANRPRVPAADWT